MHGRLDMGHARALLPLEGAIQVAAANKIVADGLSVREAEKLVQNMLNPVIKKSQQKVHHSRDIVRLQEKVADQLGAKVGIRHEAKGNGKLIIEYKNLDQLGGILGAHVTLIDPRGKILGDSSLAPTEVMAAENISGRKEFQDALAKGSGSEERLNVKDKKKYIYRR